MTNPSQKSHPAWLKKWLMAFPNCTSMAIPLALKEVLYEKIMSNFSKTSVWKEKLQFTAFFYNCKIFSDREIYILGCDLCIYITIKNVCTWSLNYFVVVALFFASAIFEYTKSLVNTNLFYFNFTDTHFRKAPISHVLWNRNSFTKTIFLHVVLTNLVNTNFA